MLKRRGFGWGGSSDEAALRWTKKRLGVLSLLRVLGPRAVILDEAQHIAQVPGVRGHANILDDIKDCVTRTGIVHVLAGTYELSPLIAPSDQLGRRSRIVSLSAVRCAAQG